MGSPACERATTKRLPAEKRRALSTQSVQFHGLSEDGEMESGQSVIILRVEIPKAESLEVDKIRLSSDTAVLQ